LRQIGGGLLEEWHRAVKFATSKKYGKEAKERKRNRNLRRLARSRAVIDIELMAKTRIYCKSAISASFSEYYFELDTNSYSENIFHQRIYICSAIIGSISKSGKPPSKIPSRSPVSRAFKSKIYASHKFLKIAHAKFCK
jgi:hypothetical protein